MAAFVYSFSIAFEAKKIVLSGVRPVQPARPTKLSRPTPRSSLFSEFSGHKFLSAGGNAACPPRVR
ncbi:MAG: hypothetical protein ACKOEI_13720, partial [Chthoniobacterales bacterium]